MKKNKFVYIVFIAILSFTCINCSDWTEPEAKDFFETPKDTYYEALRAYKKSDHQVAFGWFGNWTAVGASLVNSMRGIPDSIDVVSVWGNWSNLTPEKKADLEFCQKVKGTKFLLCFIIANIGDQITPQAVRDNYEANGFESASDAVKDFWGWKDGDDASIENAIRKYADAICDTVHKYNYDGFDIDYEPNFGNSGNLASYKPRMAIFINQLSKQLGPKSNTGKLLVVDGEPQSIPGETGTCFDYFIVQAYKPDNDTELDNRLLGKGRWEGKGAIENFTGYLTPEEVTNKYIVTENFESVGAAMEGGYPYTDRYGNAMKSLEGMARWQPTNGFQKAGCGCYHMEAEYPTTPEYRWMRNAIQIMNPAPHSLIK